MNYSFLVSFILVLIPLIYSYQTKLGIEKQLLINSVRAFLQLLALGYFLVFIFKINNLFLLSLVLFFMILYSSYIAKNRVHTNFVIPFLTIFLSTFIVLGIMLLTKIISTKPNEFIPIGGMIIGNALNTFTLAVERFKREIEIQTDLIESFIALGAPLKEAYKIMQLQSIKASLIPTINMLQTIGVVAIPGITTGMLLAGASPLTAVSYQLVIIYMLVSINLFSSLFGIIFYIKLLNFNIKTISILKN
ncbi:MAG: iron export ABC transporter permease subunit FetB [Nautilia sp.]|nr:MAG: iron export ABC transporter permease subunit FetB [Nautilia sp.]